MEAGALSLSWAVSRNIHLLERLLCLQKANSIQGIHPPLSSGDGGQGWDVEKEPKLLSPQVLASCGLVGAGIKKMIMVTRSDIIQ